MSNVLLAKNSFLNGLIMDFSPDNTQATCMTSALNATLLTFNGNELTLQNDMGNGRVETARLPEGYIPVGTCEFGDIIYIVSYNPILNKSQIGCFPSPERNISSDEIGDLNQTLSNNDFLELKKVYTFDYNGETYIKEDKTNYIGVYTYQSKSIEIQDYKETEEGIKVIIDSEEYKLSEKSIPTGILAKTSVKKVLLETKKLNPGDKYIIYTDNLNDLTGNSACLSDWGQGKHGELPQNVKLHVVSIEDSGKITYLDSTTKWYNIDSTNNTDYYINCKKLKEDGTSDIDTFRNLLESNWSIFSSKVSGKLAILAELETIDTFSCSYELEYTGEDTDPATKITYKKYSLTLYPSYTSSHESITPAYICATRSTFSNLTSELSPYQLKYNYIIGETTQEKIDDIGVSEKIETPQEGTDPKINIKGFEANNSSGWGWPTETRKIDTNIIFKIPYKLFVNEQYIPIKSDSFVYNLDLVPCMSFGRLEHLKQTITIDFNKVGTGEIELTDWKYHNSDITSILTYGINSYLKPLHEIKGIIIDFYDNKGLAAEYVLEGKKSYNGIFTEYIQFGSKLLNYKVRNEQIKISTLRNLDLPPTTGQDSTSPERLCTKLSDLDTVVIRHAGEKLEAAPSDYDSNEDLYVKEEPQPQGQGNQATYYKNDSGIIYPNWLYAVKIYVISGRIDNKQQWEYKSFERWYWTTSMFNEHYYDTSDFDILPFKLTLNSQTTFESKSNFIWQESSTNNLITNEFNPENIEETYSANIVSIGTDDKPNINMYVHAGLLNDYGCFNLLYKASDNPISNIQMDIYIDSGNINYDNFDYEFSNEQVEITEENFIKKKPITISAKQPSNTAEGTEGTEGGTESTEEDTLDLSDLFYVTIHNASDADEINDPDDPEDQTKKLLKYSRTLADCYDETGTKPIELIYKSVLHNKAYILNIYSSPTNVPVYSPIINSTEDLGRLGISNQVFSTSDKIDEYNIKPVRLYFSRGYNLAMYNDVHAMAPLNFNWSGDKAIVTNAAHDDNDTITTIKNYINVPENEEYKSIWEKAGANSGNTFFLCYPGGFLGGGRGRARRIKVVRTSKLSRFNTTNWKDRYFESGYSKANNDLSLDGVIIGQEFDIQGASTIADVNKYNTTPFLGINIGESFILINSVYKANYTNSSTITLKSVYENNSDNSTRFVDNFAQQLFLLLTNTYHKNKTLEANAIIHLNNIVTNKEFTATLTKDIIVELSEKKNTSTANDIAFYKESFNGYTSTITSLPIDPTKPETKVFTLLSLDNITLHYESSAVSNTLNVSKKVKPLILDEMNIKCGFSKYGSIVWWHTDLEPGQFYLFKENHLSKYQNQTYKFDRDEIKKIVKYIFKDDLMLYMYRTRLSDKCATSKKEYILKFKELLIKLDKLMIDANSNEYSINGESYEYTVINKKLVEFTIKLPRQFLKDLIDHCHNKILMSTGSTDKDSLKLWLLTQYVGDNNLFRPYENNYVNLGKSEDDSDLGFYRCCVKWHNKNNCIFNFGLLEDIKLKHYDCYGFDCGLRLNELFDYELNNLKFKKYIAKGETFSLSSDDSDTLRGGFLADCYLDKDFRFNLEDKYNFDHYE